MTLPWLYHDLDLDKYGPGSGSELGVWVYVFMTIIGGNHQYLSNICD